MWGPSLLNTTRPLVSVLVPAHNAEQHIGVCIDSLLEQSYSPFEIIVVDDGSTDRTWQVVAAYAEQDRRVVGVRGLVNTGVAAARNRALSVARGQYVMLQDADDLSVSSRMSRLVSYLETSGADFVSSGHYLFDDTGSYAVKIPKAEQPTKLHMLYGVPFCHAATAFRRDCLDDVGGYMVSEYTRRGEDYDLFMRLYARGFRGVNIPDVLYGYRVDSRTLSRRTFEYRLDECRIRWRGFSELGLMPWALPFVLKPIVAHALQSVRHR